MTEPSSPKLDVLVRALRLMTLNQFAYFVTVCEGMLAMSGHGEVILQFKDGHVHFIQPCPSLLMPKPEPELQEAYGMRP